MSLSKQEADLQGLRTEGRKLQAILATVTSDYDVYLKKYNDVSERISANLKSAQEASKVNVARASSEIAVVLVLIDATSHQVCDTG
ncbi:hypothetical protein J4E81_005841 [Alternaria sp. BMP 2799]|nr:hypothetical protein J4E81_005841 [Alternaria sp. BMP 2799]